MKKIFFVAMSIFFCCITACSHPFMSATFKSCKVSCVERSVLCNKSCRSSCQQCTRYEIATAKKSFSRYLKEGRIQGERVTRILNSYRDPLQCRKSTCNCAADYDVCIQACGGIIKKRLKVPTVC